MTPEAQELALLRERVLALGEGEHRLASDKDGRFVEVKTRGGMLLPILRFDQGATEAEIAFYANAAEMVRLLDRLLRRCARRVRELTATAEGRKPDGASAGQAAPPEGQPPAGGGTPREAQIPNFAAEASMRCAEPAFKRWLMDCHGLDSPATDERTAQKLRGLLGVQSRRDLNDDAAAAARWRKLRGEFEAWKRAG